MGTIANDEIPQLLVNSLNIVISLPVLYFSLLNALRIHIINIIKI